MKKRIGALLSVIMMLALTACQPTPEEGVVIGKGDGELERIIAATDAPTGNYEVPATWEDAFEFSEQSLKIVVDAMVEIPDTQQFPVVRISPAEMTQEQVDKVIATLMQGQPLYKPRSENELTKAEIQNRIVELRAGWNSDLNADDPQAYEKSIEPEIERLMQQYETAPDTYEPVPADGKFGTKKSESEDQYDEEGRLMPRTISPEDNYGKIDIVAELGQQKPASLSAYRSEDKYFSYIRFSNYEGNYYAVPFSTSNQIEGLKGVTMSFEDARALAETTVRNAGFDNMVLSATGTEDLIDPASEKDDTDKQCYFFAFTPSINGISVTVTSQLLSNTFFGANEAYGQLWPTERILVRVGETGILDFDWRSPSQMLGTETENVALLPFSQIQEMFEQQMKIQGAWQEDEHIIAREVHIERVTLGYDKISGKDCPGEYLLVPVWDFIGYSIDTYDKQQSGGAKLDENNQHTEDIYSYSYLTINAIDGSIIDRNLGY